MLRLGFTVCALGVALHAFSEGFPEHYGGDAGGTRYAPLAEITPASVGKLSIAWTYRTGDLAKRDAKAVWRSKFQVTPILADGHLVLCTPFNEVIALDPGTGTEI